MQKILLRKKWPLETEEMPTSLNALLALKLARNVVCSDSVVYPNEAIVVNSNTWHSKCFKCECGIVLNLMTFVFSGTKVYCKKHVPKHQATIGKDSVSLNAAIGKGIETSDAFSCTQAERCSWGKKRRSINICTWKITTTRHNSTGIPKSKEPNLRMTVEETIWVIHFL